MHKHLPCTLSRLSSSKTVTIVRVSGCLPRLHTIRLYWFRTRMTTGLLPSLAATPADLSIVGRGSRCCFTCAFTVRHHRARNRAFLSQLFSRSAAGARPTLSALTISCGSGSASDGGRPGSSLRIAASRTHPRDRREDRFHAKERVPASQLKLPVLPAPGSAVRLRPAESGYVGPPAVAVFDRSSCWAKIAGFRLGAPLFAVSHRTTPQYMG